MAALGGGLVALVLGIIGIIIWWGFFIKALLAAVPAMLILGGALAVYLGVEELRDKRRADSFDDTAGNLKSEVDGLKDEIKELKKEKTEEEKGES